MSQPTDKPRLSIIIPLYREADNVEPLYKEMVAALGTFEPSFELIFVDDGSDDPTFAILKGLARSDERVRALRFTKNFGQTAALQAGFDHARGEILVTIDGDLQNDPKDIERLLEGISEGYDLVVGWRKDRQDKLLSRRFPSTAANWTIRLLTGVAIHDNGCALKACRREVLKGSPLYADMHRYLTVVVAMAGGTYKEIVVNHRPRSRGVSKYGVSRVWKVLLDLISLTMLARFLRRPAQWFGLLSLAPLFFATVALVLSLLQYAQGGVGDRFPIVYAGAVVLFTFALVHLLLMAVIGEMVVWLGRIRAAERPPKIPGLLA